MAIVKRLILIAILLGCGGYLVYSSCTAIVDGFASRTWPVVLGTITESRLETELVTETSGDKRTTYYRYRAIIGYAYTVGAQHYTGDQYSVEGIAYSGKSRRKAEQYLNRYPLGNTVSVYYNPQKPATAVLVRGAAGWAVWLLLAMGLGFLGAAAVSAIPRRRPFASGNVSVRVPPPLAVPATPFPTPPQGTADAPAYRVAEPTDPATRQSWQATMVPRGVITDWTARFFGSPEWWGPIEVGASNLHGYWGGREVHLAGDGRAVIQIARMAHDQARHDLTLTPAEAQQLLALFVQHDALTIAFPRRAVPPDERATTLTLRNAAGQGFTLTRYDQDFDEGGRFAAIAGPLLALADRIELAQSGAYTAAAMH